jgi:hypothetical protein
VERERDDERIVHCRLCNNSTVGKRRAVVEDSLTVEEARKIDRAIRCQKICVETVHEDGSEDEDENKEGVAGGDEGWEGEDDDEDGDNLEREQDENIDEGHGDVILGSGDGRWD